MGWLLFIGSGWRWAAGGPGSFITDSYGDPAGLCILNGCQALERSIGDEIFHLSLRSHHVGPCRCCFCLTAPCRVGPKGHVHWFPILIEQKACIFWRSLDDVGSGVVCLRALSQQGIAWHELALSQWKTDLHPVPMKDEPSPYLNEGRTLVLSQWRTSLRPVSMKDGPLPCPNEGRTFALSQWRTDPRPVPMKDGLFLIPLKDGSSHPVPMKDVLSQWRTDSILSHWRTDPRPVPMKDGPSSCPNEARTIVLSQWRTDPRPVPMKDGPSSCPNEGQTLVLSQWRTGPRPGPEAQILTLVQWKRDPYQMKPPDMGQTK